jgi:hypothetical protein
MNRCLYVSAFVLMPTRFWTSIAESKVNVPNLTAVNIPDCISNACNVDSIINFPAAYAMRGEKQKSDPSNNQGS